MTKSTWCSTSSTAAAGRPRRRAGSGRRARRCRRRRGRRRARRAAAAAAARRGPGPARPLLLGVGQVADRAVGVAPRGSSASSWRAARRVAGGRPSAEAASGTSTFSRTVRPGTGRGPGGCGRRPAADSRVGPRARARRRRGSCPRSGATSPHTALNSVVLPAPFGPMRPTISPARHVEGHVVEGGQAAEAHGQAADRRDAARPPCGRASCCADIGTSSCR